MRKIIHNLCNSKTYHTWESMLQRCNNPKNPNYVKYGYRGVRVCEEWNNFCNFLKDMGIRPEGKTLDRIDNFKGYYKENCRWATKKEQQNNHRNTKFLDFNKKHLTLSQWADFLGVNRELLRGRLRRGWSLEKTLMGLYP